MKLFGLKTCDTCRTARKALPEAQYVDVRDDGVSAEILQAAFAEFGDALVNKRSTTWRQLSEQERARPALELLQEHPTLMKRPLIQHDDGGLFLGWTKETKGALGLGGAS